MRIQAAHMSFRRPQYGVGPTLKLHSALSFPWMLSRGRSTISGVRLHRFSETIKKGRVFTGEYNAMSRMNIANNNTGLHSQKKG